MKYNPSSFHSVIFCLYSSDSHFAVNQGCYGLGLAGCIMEIFGPNFGFRGRVEKFQCWVWVGLGFEFGNQAQAKKNLLQ